MSEFINRLIYVFKREMYFMGNEKGGFKMKKNVSKIRLVVFLLAVMAMVLGASMTVSASTTVQVRKTAYLRDAPTAAGDPIIKIKKNTYVTAGISQGKYTRVIYKKNGNTYAGWFYTSYLTGSGSGVYRTVRTAVNLRTGPSTSYRQILTIPEGASVEVLGTKDGWYKVKYNGRTGYIAPGYFTGDTTIRYTKTASYLRSTPYKDAQNRNVITTIPANKAVTVISYTNGWAYVNYNGRHGYVHGSLLRS
jgi:uncharacterized protein YgiM (DUF1202 family)